MNLNYISFIVSIAGIIITVSFFFLQSFQLWKAVKITFEMDVRKLIDRIERNKKDFKESEPKAYKEFFDIQEELETISRKFLKIFNTK